MTFYVIENNQTTVGNLTTVISQHELDVKVAMNLEQAFALITAVGDDDIVSLDSQVPNPGDGELVAEALRKAGKACLIIWHSSLKAPDPERLGIYECQWPQSGWFEKVQACAKIWKDKRDSYRYEDKAKHQDLCSKLLTPLVLLHLSLQTVTQDKNDKSKKLSREEIELCEKGIALLKNNTLEIEKTLCELMGIPHPGKGNSLEPLNQLRKWLLENAEMLVLHFEYAKTSGQFPWLEQEKLRSVLTTIEDLSQIVDCAVEYGERIKKNSSMRHFLKNAVPRLAHYFTDLNREMRLALDLEMKDIESSLLTFLAPSPSYGLDSETKGASGKVLASVRKFRAKLAKEDNEQNLLNELKGLVEQLETLEKLTFNSPEASLS